MRLFRFTSINLLAVLVIILLSVSSFFFFLPAYHLVLKDIIKESAIQTADYLADPIKVKGQTISKKTIKPEYGKFAAEFIRDRWLIKLQVLSDQGRIVYSSDPSEIDTVYTHGHLFNATVKGRPMAMVVGKGGSSRKALIQAPYVVETYVPVVAHGKFLGAFVFYNNITVSKKRFDLVFEKYIVTVLPISFVCGGTDSGRQGATKPSTAGNSGGRAAEGTYRA